MHSTPHMILAYLQLEFTWNAPWLARYWIPQIWDPKTWINANNVNKFEVLAKLTKLFYMYHLNCTMWHNESGLGEMSGMCDIVCSIAHSIIV